MAVTFRRWHRSPGRGWIAVMRSDLPDADIPAITPGEPIEIDGHTYVCAGLDAPRAASGFKPDFGIIIQGEPQS